VEWDTKFLARFARNDKQGMLSYSDEETYADAGQGGYEIRTLIATASAARGSKANIHFFEPIPVFATSAFCASFEL